MAKKSLYSQTPVVPAKKIAGTNPMGAVGIGPEKPKMVPQAQPTIHGLDTTPHSFKTPAIKGAQRYGNVAKIQGNYRLSGHAGAHRVGGKK